MIGIIQDWLFKLGLNFNLNSLAENNYFQDGCVIADILLKYGVLSDNFRTGITPTSDHVESKKNLILLKPLFTMLKVNYDDSIIHGMVEGKISIILKLLYELYVCLENKQHLYFITQNNYEKVLQHLMKVSIFEQNELKSDISLDIKRTCFEAPLIQNKDMTEWYKNKYRLVQNNLQKRLNQLKNELCNKVEQDFNQGERTCFCSYGGDTDINAPLPDLDTFLKFNNSEHLLSYDEFILKFKNKQHNSTAKKRFESSIQNELLQQTWSKLMKKQNQLYNSVFSKIMLKQSQYEKQIFTKLMQTQKQIQVQNENQIEVSQKLFHEQEKQLNCDFQLKEQFQELEEMYINEKKRVLELHRKLYKEKQDLMKKMRLSLCIDIMDTLIDIAVNASDYKSMYGVQVPKNLWKDWMQLFYKAQPISIPFQKLENDILKNETIDYDEVITSKKIEDSILDENDVDEYLFTCGRWFYEEICLEAGDINEIVLAFVIYRLLSLKYPPPESPLPADIPPFKSANVLLNFENPDHIAKLTLLLSKQCIHVFDTETVVKKSIDAYKKETSPPIGEKSKSKKNKTSIKSKKDKVKNKKLQEGKINKRSLKKKSRKKDTEVQPEGNIKEEENIISLIDKETQTSITKEVVEVLPTRTPLGLIGEQVFNLLKEGGKIEDTLLVSVIIEYLKSLEDVKGWLLLNYPLTLNQAAIIELSLTGKYLPLDNYISEGNKVFQEVQADKFSENRKSKLLPSFKAFNDKSSFKSHFTHFMVAKENVGDNCEPKNIDLMTSSVFQNVDLNLEHIQEDNPLQVSQPDVLEMFYKDQSIYQDFYYDIFDINTLKKLARIILKEDDISEMNSVDLFGEECLNKLIKNKKNPKGKKTSSSGKQKSTKKAKKKSVKGKVITDELPDIKHTSMSEEENVNATVELDTNKPGSFHENDIEQRIVRPGDEDWQFVHLPIDNELSAVMATIWENIENCYISNLKDIFFQHRIIGLRLIPYSTYVQEEVQKFSNKADMKQDLINIFIDYYNNIDKSLRALPDMKSQLHCKILEMQQNLWQIADFKKEDTERKRQSLIHENWLPNELCHLINNYLSLVQTEFDRSFETMKLVNDYYLSMLGKSPPAVINIQRGLSRVGKLSQNNFLSTQEEIPQNVFKTKADHNKSHSSGSYDIQANPINIISRCLTNCTEKERVFTVINEFLIQEIMQVKRDMRTVLHYFNNQIKTESDLLASVKKKAVTEKMVSTKKKEMSKKNLTNITNKKTSLIKSVIENEVNDNVSKNDCLLNEWQFITATEVDRFNFRLDLITKRAEEDIMEFYCYLESVFCDLYSSTLSKYNTEISNINKACEYLKTAIEEETPLVYPPVFSSDSFYINTIKKLIRESEDISIKELTEQYHECYFTISQLNKLMNVFKIAGPEGVIIKHSFCYILQDLMLFNDDNNHPHLPKMWSFLSGSQLKTLLDIIFGPVYAIDWRDFILYNLEIPYPNVDNILTLRNTFMLYDIENTEVVTLEDYEKVVLWFEEVLPQNPEEGLRIAMIKKLLFEMFQVDENNINYTALLLYFCKDLDPHAGFGKALSLSLGKKAIISIEELNEIKKHEAEIIETVTTLLSDIINNIVINRDGVLIYEVFDSDQELYSNRSESGKSYSVSSKATVSDFYVEEIYEDITTLRSSLLANDWQNECKASHRSIKYDSPDKYWISKIPVSTIISVLNASLHIQDKTLTFREHYIGSLEEEADSEGTIEAHVLVKLSCIQKIFRMTNKFKISSPCEVLKQCLKC